MFKWSYKVVKPASEGAGSTQKEERHEDKIDCCGSNDLVIGPINGGSPR